LCGIWRGDTCHHLRIFLIRQCCHQRFTDIGIGHFGQLIGQVSDISVRPDQREIAKFVVDRAIERMKKLHGKLRVLIVIGYRDNWFVGVDLNVDVVIDVLLKKRTIRWLPVVMRHTQNGLHEFGNGVHGRVRWNPLFGSRVPSLVEYRVHDLRVFCEQIGDIAGIEAFLIQHKGLGGGIPADVDSGERRQIAQSAKLAGKTPAAL